VAARLRNAGFRPVVATGEFVPAFRELGGWGRGPDPDVVPADDAEEAGCRLVERLEGDEVVLVKGSRGAGLEAAVRALEEAFGGRGGRGPEGAGRGSPGGDRAGDRAGTAGEGG